MDDDIIIGKKYLEMFISFFKENKNIDIVFGSIKLKINCFTQDIWTILTQNKFFNLKKCLASTMILKKSFKQIKFDERFGLGAIYPSSEETELIFNCLIKKNYKIKYYPIIELFHQTMKF